MKIVFMGTPDFSAVVLDRLNQAYPVCAVVTAQAKGGGIENPCLAVFKGI